MHIDVDGVRLFHSAIGAGEPIVLVHGSWVDHRSWDAVAPLLAERHTVIAYDRRGHSGSAAERPATVHDHVSDLAALVAALGLGPVHLVANSYGGSIALRTAALHPDRFRSLAAHEPPLFGTLGASTPFLQVAREEEARVAALVRAGRLHDAARTFVEDVALGPGSWERLPGAMRDTLVRNAPTFLAECDDPDARGIDLTALSAFRGPVLLTQGDRSPPLFAPVLERVAAALPQAVRHTFAGAGHIPHQSHPREFVERVEDFVAAAGAAAAPRRA